MGEIKVPSAGNWMKGEFVKDNKITEVVMIGDEPTGVVGEFGYKVEATINYENQGKEDPTKISWNKTSARILVDVLGKDPKGWLNKTIPIESGKTDKGYAIYVDEKILREIHQGK